MQAKDNSWYLTRDINGDHSIVGSIFLDYRNKSDFSDEYNIIYGHRTDKGRMFSDIAKFFDEKFFEENTEASLKTKNGEKKLDIVAIAKVEVFGEIYDFYVRQNNSLEKNLELIRSKANYSRNGEYRRLYVLSTCDKDSQRYRNILVLGEK